MAQSSGGTHAGGVPGAGGVAVLKLSPSEGVAAAEGASVSITGEPEGAAGGLACWRAATEVEDWDWARPMAHAKGPLPAGNIHKSAMSIANAAIRIMATQMSSRVSQSGRFLELSSGLVFLRFMPSTERYAVNSQIIA